MMPIMGIWMKTQTDFDNMTLGAQKSLLAKKYLDGVHVDIVLPCWKIERGKEHAKEHCGLHTEIMYACSEDPEFPRIISSCREQAEKLWARGHLRVRVVCVCNQGRHRSVAVSAILQAVHSQMGFNSKGPNHLSEKSWWKKMCTTCPECRPNPKKVQLFRKLAATYETVE